MKKIIEISKKKYVTLKYCQYFTYFNLIFNMIYLIYCTKLNESCVIQKDVVRAIMDCLIKNIFDEVPLTKDFIKEEVSKLLL